MSINKKKVLAAFDFDSTITLRDSLPVFIRFAVSKGRLLKGTLAMVPTLILYMLRIIPNYTAKQKLLKVFFAGLSPATFDSIAQNFVPVVEKIINPEALQKIKWHQLQGHEVVIISASVENWIIPWAKKNGINTVLATRLQIKEDHITGSFLNKNCKGAEKVTRLLAYAPDRASYILYAYGDSNGDKELLALADHSFYRSF